MIDRMYCISGSHLYTKYVLGPVPIFSSLAARARCCCLAPVACSMLPGVGVPNMLYNAYSLPCKLDLCTSRIDWFYSSFFPFFVKFVVWDCHFLRISMKIVNDESRNEAELPTNVLPEILYFMP